MFHVLVLYLREQREKLPERPMYFRPRGLHTAMLTPCWSEQNACVEQTRQEDRATISVACRVLAR